MLFLFFLLWSFIGSIIGLILRLVFRILLIKTIIMVCLVGYCLHMAGIYLL